MLLTAVNLGVLTGLERLLLENLVPIKANLSKVLSLVIKPRQFASHKEECPDSSRLLQVDLFPSDSCFFYFLATTKVKSEWVSTYHSMHLW